MPYELQTDATSLSPSETGGINSADGSDNPSTGLSPASLRAAAVTFDAAATAFRSGADELGHMAADLRRAGITPGTGEQIALTSGASFLADGARALDEAARRARTVQCDESANDTAAGTRAADACAPDAPSPTCPTPSAFLDLPLERRSQRYELLAQSICRAMDRAVDAARKVGPSIAGDTHPYGDVQYGITLPYLYLAIEETREPGDRQSAPTARPLARCSVTT